MIKALQEQNKNSDFTLIARDCVGGVLYHQLGLQFRSPTINLFFTPDDFNWCCLHLKDYLRGNLVDAKEKSIPYPVGTLYPRKGSAITKAIQVHFMHYETFLEAKRKWNARKKRINFDNLYVVSSFCYSKEVETLSPKLVEDWNQIPYKKVMLVDQKYGFDGEFVIAKPQECEEYAWLLYSPNPKEPELKTFNDFDFLKFLNE